MLAELRKPFLIAALVLIVVIVMVWDIKDKQCLLWHREAGGLLF